MESFGDEGFEKLGNYETQSKRKGDGNKSQEFWLGQGREGNIVFTEANVLLSVTRTSPVLVLETLLIMPLLMTILAVPSLLMLVESKAVVPLPSSNL